MRYVLILVGICALAVSRAPQPQDTPAQAGNDLTAVSGLSALNEFASDVDWCPPTADLFAVTECPGGVCPVNRTPDLAPELPAQASELPAQAPRAVRSIVVARRPVVMRSRQVMRGAVRTVLPPYPRVRAVMERRPVRRVLGAPIRWLRGR